MLVFMYRENDCRRCSSMKYQRHNTCNSCSPPLDTAFYFLWSAVYSNIIESSGNAILAIDTLRVGHFSFYGEQEILRWSCNCGDTTCTAQSTWNPTCTHSVVIIKFFNQSTSHNVCSNECWHILSKKCGSEFNSTKEPVFFLVVLILSNRPASGYGVDNILFKVAHTE